MERGHGYNFINEYNKELEQKRFSAIESFLELSKKDSNQEKNNYRLNELIKIISNFDLSVEDKEEIINRFGLVFTKDKIKDLTPSDLAIALLDNHDEEKQDIISEPEQKEPVEDLIEKESKEENEIDFPIINYDGVILPSFDKKPNFTAEGIVDLEKESRPRFRLLKKIIKDLNIDKGVYVISGKRDKDMMRDGEYKAVVIPENDKLVLVCDAYGNATYISHQTMKDNSVLLGLNKEELKNLSFVSSIIWTNDAEKWQEKISEELFEVNENKLSDIEVIEELEENKKNNQEQKDNKEHTVEELKDEIKKQFPTALDWIKDLSTKKIENFEILGNGLGAIATKFGLKGEISQSKENWLKLGEKIYEKNKIIKAIELIKKQEKEVLKQEILTQFPTVENWIGLTQVKKQEIKISGLGLMAIATKFGVEGDPVKLHKVYLLLGQKIFIDDNEVIKEELEKIEEKNREYTEQELRNKIKEKYKTAKDWINLNCRQNQKIKFFGLGLMAIARKFGVEGNPVKLHKVHLLLGQKIYGIDNKFIEKELAKIEEKELAKIEEKDNKKYTVEELKKEILIQFPTAEDWAGLTKAQKQKIKIFGLGLIAIATKFGVKGKPANSHEDHLLLGQKIYGKDNEVIKKELKRADEGYSFQELKDEIFEQFPTVKDWIKLTSKQRQEIKIFGFGLLAIATKFGVEGNPVGIYKDHLFLGQKIYVKDNAVITEELKKYTKQNLES